MDEDVEPTGHGGARAGVCLPSLTTVASQLGWLVSQKPHAIFT